MESRPFGKTGMVVSVYGLGTWAMGGGIYGPADDAESVRMIHAAEDLGINYIDTAPMYGIAERKDGRAECVVGQALDGRRDRWIIGTKYGRHLNGNADWDDMDCDFSATDAVRSVEASLKRLKTDYLDVLFVHSPFRKDFDPQDAFEGMARLKKAGKIRTTGFSFLESVDDTLDLVEPYLRSGECDAVQVKLSLMTTDTQRLMLPIIDETGTAIVAREVLARGFLADAFRADGPFDPQDWKSQISRETIQAQLDKADQFRILIDRTYGIESLPQAALNYVVSHPQVSCVIPGPRTLSELNQCLEARSAKPYEHSHLQQVVAIQDKWDD